LGPGEDVAHSNEESSAFTLVLISRLSSCRALLGKIMNESLNESLGKALPGSRRHKSAFPFLSSLLHPKKD
jgi:hypothetical protein